MAALQYVLVTGANGQLGTALQRCAWPADWRVVAFDRNALDLTDLSAIAAVIASRPWAAIINAAAYTAVDRAESDQVTAWVVNALAPAAIAAGCVTSNIPMVQVSTDYVFAGDKPEPWNENDPVSPRSVYGASKLGGELAVLSSGARHAIVRTAWVVSAHGRNFVTTMLQLARERDLVDVVGDQRGSPTSATDLAQALVTITVRLAGDPAAPNGTFHFSNVGPTTWAAFATEIFRSSALRGGPSAAVASILTSGYPTPAQRPTNSLLAHQAIQKAYGIHPRAWSEALGEILDQLLGKTS